MQRGMKRGDHGLLRAPAQGFVTVGNLLEIARKTDRSLSPPSLLPLCRLAQPLGRAVERRNLVSIRGRFLVGVWPQHRVEDARELMDRSELGLLIIGDEALNRADARH